jgi:hypothetical protein
VVDTSLLADAGSHRWLQGVTGEEEKLAAGTDSTVEIPPYAGHGMFIAGVARCFAPDAGVHVALPGVGPVLGVGPVFGARPSLGPSMVRSQWSALVV